MLVSSGVVGAVASILRPGVAIVARCSAVSCCLASFTGWAGCSFHEDGGALELRLIALHLTIWVAEHVSSIPGNVWPTPRLPVWGLAITAFGGLWLCLWQGRWRRWGALGIAVGMATMLLTRPPDIAIADFGRFVAARAANGDYYVIGGNDERIAKSLFAEETGAELLPWPAPGTEADPLSCADGACLYTARGKRVAIVTDDRGLPSGCDAVDAIVSQVPAGFACRHTIPVIDRIDTWRRGAVALWLDAGGIAVLGANDSRGDRPWVPHPVAAKKAPEPAQ
jgi:competence protein ComEC